MPEFENLEPYLDRDGGRILPVAPHSTPAHDFVLRRREPRAERPARRRPATPEPVAVTGVEQLTTRDMEKAYRAAMKESRIRQKSHARKQGKTLWSRLSRWLSGVFKKPTAASEGKPPQRRERHEGRGPRREHDQNRKFKRPAGASQQSGSGDASAGGGNRPPRNRSRGRGPNRSRDRQPGGAPSTEGKTNDRPQRDTSERTPRGESNKAPSQANSEQRSRRRRGNGGRKRPSSDGSSQSQSPSQPRSAE